MRKKVTPFALRLTSSASSVAQNQHDRHKDDRVFKRIPERLKRGLVGEGLDIIRPTDKLGRLVRVEHQSAIRKGIENRHEKRQDHEQKHDDDRRRGQPPRGFRLRAGHLASPLRPASLDSDFTHTQCSVLSPCRLSVSMTALPVLAFCFSGSKGKRSARSAFGRPGAM